MKKRWTERRTPPPKTVPIHLARLLAAEPEDLKDPQTYKDVRDLGKALLAVLEKV